MNDAKFDSEKDLPSDIRICISINMALFSYNTGYTKQVCTFFSLFIYEYIGYPFVAGIVLCTFISTAQ